MFSPLRETHLEICVGEFVMRSAGSISLGTAMLCLGLVTVIAAQQPSSGKAAEGKPAAPPSAAQAKPAVSHTAAGAAAAASADYNGLVKKYCVGCHNDRNKDRVASLTLASFDIARAGEHADVAAVMIGRLQASMMPPPGMPRPEPAVYQGFIRALETTVDAHAKLNP